MAKVFDFITAMFIIDLVHESDYRGDRAFLKFALGNKTFKTMAAMGYIHGGVSLVNEKVVHTYAVTRTFKSWKKRLFKR